MQQRQRARDQVLLTQQLVEEERRKAEEKLQRRVDRMKTLQQQQQSGASLTPSSTSGPTSPLCMSHSHLPTLLTEFCSVLTVYYTVY